jgi:predicted RNase H-like HicB family nuclease
MVYRCKIWEEDGLFIAQFPDMMFIATYGFTHAHALEMAEEALNLVLEVELEDGHPIPPPTFRGGYPITVDPKLAAAMRIEEPELQVA